MIKELDWDSKFFGFKIGSCQGRSLEEKGMDEFIKEFGDKKLDCAYIFCDEKDLICQKFGEGEYSLIFPVDGHVKYELSKKDWVVDKKPKAVPGKYSVINGGDKNEVNTVKEIELLSEDTALVSRFYIDPKLRPQARAMYKIWVDNILNDKNGLTTVNIVDSQITGMVACLLKDDVGVVELVKVKAGFEGMGIAGKLMECAINALFERGAEKISVTTQIGNEPARHLYERSGFQLKQTTKIYHWWK
ncbi:MAG: GNAT family N-acetyltransferase [Patescibacteria group bacterium]